MSGIEFTPLLCVKKECARLSRSSFVILGNRQFTCQNYLKKFLNGPNGRRSKVFGERLRSSKFGRARNFGKEQRTFFLRVTYIYAYLTCLCMIYVTHTFTVYKLQGYRFKVETSNPTGFLEKQISPSEQSNDSLKETDRCSISWCLLVAPQTVWGLRWCNWFLDSLLDCVEVLLLSFVVIQCDDLACFHNSFMARTNLCYDLAKATKASDGKKIQNDHLFELRSFAVQKVYLQGDIIPLVKHMAFAGRMRRLDLQPIIRRIRAKQSRYFVFGIWMYTTRGERGSRLSGRPSK